MIAVIHSRLQTDLTLRIQNAEGMRHDRAQPTTGSKPGCDFHYRRIGCYDSRGEWHRIVLWGKLAEAAAKLAKGAYVEIEGDLRHRTYQKEVRVGEKAIAVDIPVTEVHARILRKLDRSTARTESEVTEEAPE